ncbi:Phosphopantothenate-cysteine ligase [Desulfonispora thiosulfatigenes DSM 11270]|uniref:Coenzyme A biosynthesis bifunctional protein CoaBC n=1 Tax=Desulfonispora thiosulfatigenes DSM 11270 TaxID=656914 RepID=A0A1W1VJA9_DESTI|nr:bifunctional phosphopantothenoylcysteine decarboxylase/phosphopantothenate--cysteine ligase CoaBC [Desulfonispora thiosulfatigenes]SMB93363.1 Phosphopantothenate-cysteine ligase [Desulfonispora thiosulfatigenes DSM 11270]
MLKDKNIVIGITGGIAAYKSCEIISLMKKSGANIHCVMTKEAMQFITPLTLRTLSGNEVITDLFSESKNWNVEHISLAKMADVFLVAPATANIIGKIANGICDDFLTTTIMATKAKVVFAPAMNVNMYENPILKDNISKLKHLGYEFIDPIVGNLACGDSGKGKMADPKDIVNYLYNLSGKKQDLKGVSILITAGPTRELIDPVRYITNRSSGKMGYAIARVAKERGADVTLISGPTNLPRPEGIKFIQIETALEMFTKVKENFASNNIVIKAAAVADYRPKNIANQKIKKSDGDMHIELERNPDILAFLGEQKGDKILVGFAAETNDLTQNALTKLKKKNLDLIVANDVSQEGAGFNYDTNKVTIFSATKETNKLPLMSKLDVADKIIDEAVTLLKKE